MLREIAFIVIPLALPTLLLRLWRFMKGRQHEPMPWLTCLAAGVGLMAVVLSLLAVYERDAPGGTYRPPHIENGRIVPGGAR